jgi:cation transport protein ChaC
MGPTRRNMGRPSTWRLSDQELEESRRNILGDCDARKDLWMFAYGSLIWDPTLAAVSDIVVSH